MKKQKGYPNLIVQPEKFTPERAQHAAEVLRATGSMRQTAEAVGVSRKTLKQWHRKSLVFKEAFDRWQQLQWKRQLHRGDMARLHLRHAEREAKTGGNESQNELEQGACCPDPPQPGKPLADSHTGRVRQFQPSPEEVRQMWQRWEADKAQAKEAERQRDILPGCDVGG